MSATAQTNLVILEAGQSLFADCGNVPFAPCNEYEFGALMQPYRKKCQILACFAGNSKRQATSRKDLLLHLQDDFSAALSSRAMLGNGWPAGTFQFMLRLVLVLQTA